MKMKKAGCIISAICLAVVLAGLTAVMGDGLEVKAAVTRNQTVGDIDASGEVTSDDADALVAHLTGNSEGQLSGDKLIAADTNGDSESDENVVVDVKDLVRYRRYLYLKNADENAANHTLSTSDGEAYTDGSNTYVIRNVEDFLCFAKNSAYWDMGGATVYDIHLKSDIKLNVGTGDVSDWNDEEQLLYKFTPIAKDGSFSELFNGENHIIRGLYCEETSDYTGLFAKVNNANGVIRNLALIDSHISGTKYVGGIVGMITGRCVNVYCNAYIEASGTYVGGIMGTIEGTVSRVQSQCWFDGNIVSHDTNVGGIVGCVGRIAANAGTKTLESCLFTGSISNDYVQANKTADQTHAHVGGLFAYTNGGSDMPLVITNCFSAGSITTAANQGVGAIASRINTPTTINNVYTICTPTRISGGAFSSNTDYMQISQVRNDAVNAVTGEVTQLAEQKLYLDGLDGYRLTNLPFVDGRSESIDTTTQTPAWCAVDWTGEDATKSGHPVLSRWKGISSFAGNDFKVVTLNQNIAKADISWYTDETNDGSSSDKAYQIADAADMRGIEIVERVEGATFQGKYFELTQDISDLSSADDQWVPIGNNTTNFRGNFNGLGNSISGIYIDSSGTYLGLFGVANNLSTISNLSITDSTIKTTATGENTFVGSLCGQMGGNISNIYSSAVVESAGGNCGGIVGRIALNSTKEVSNCWFAGSVKGGNAFVGGIAGRVFMGTRTVSNCLNTGTVTNTKSNSLTGGIFGGMRGDDKTPLNITVSNCVNDGIVIVPANSTISFGALFGNDTVLTTTNPDTIIFADNLYTTTDVVDVNGESKEGADADTVTKVTASSDLAITLGEKWLFNDGKMNLDMSVSTDTTTE